MQCPSCRSEISENQFYCPVCRASVYSYTPENSRSVGSTGQVGRAGKRLLELLLLLILIGVGVVIGRAIKWKELLSNFVPGIQSTPTKSERGTAASPNSSPASSGKRAPDKSKPSSKSGEEKPAEPASAESVRDLKQKIEELPASSGETKPAPKPTAQPTPKPPTNSN